MVSQVGQQLLRDCFAEHPVGGSGVVTVGSERSRLILHLHHQNSTLCLIDALHMLEQSVKGMRVCVHGRAAKWRDDFGLFPSRTLHTNISLLVTLHPLGCVMAFTVFPGAKP